MYFPPAAPHEKREPEGLRFPWARCGRVRLLPAFLPAFLPKDEPEGQRYHKNQDFCHRLRPPFVWFGAILSGKAYKGEGLCLTVFLRQYPQGLCVGCAVHFCQMCTRVGKAGLVEASQSREWRASLAQRPRAGMGAALPETVRRGWGGVFAVGRTVWTS